VQELSRFWGVADNGEVMELAVRLHLVERLLERWPPVGLTRHDEPIGRSSCPPRLVTTRAP